MPRSGMAALSGPHINALIVIHFFLQRPDPETHQIPEAILDRSGIRDLEIQIADLVLRSAIWESQITDPESINLRSGFCDYDRGAKVSNAFSFLFESQDGFRIRVARSRTI